LGASLLTAISLVVGGAIYIRWRWRRSPQALRAMIALAICYFAAGGLAGAVAVVLIAPRVVTTTANPPIPEPPAVGTSDYLPNKYSAKVVGVTDGDTINIMLDDPKSVQSLGLAGFSVRLLGIDAPETAQAFGPESTRHLSDLVSGKQVSLACEYDRSYGRFLCKVLLPNGEDVCLDQVKSGMAWHYKQFQDDQIPGDRSAYGAAECSAMKAKLGLWSDPHPEQPQDFRHGTNSPLLLDADGCRRSSEPTTGPVRGNSYTHIFEWPGCPNYDDISIDNRVPFPSPQAAEDSRYRPAHNCP